MIFSTSRQRPRGWMFIITNPPYGSGGREAVRFIKHALTLVPRTLMLLRADFDSAVSRVHIFRDEPRFAFSLSFFGASSGSTVLAHRRTIIVGLAGATAIAALQLFSIPRLQQRLHVEHGRLQGPGRRCRPASIKQNSEETHMQPIKQQLVSGVAQQALDGFDTFNDTSRAMPPNKRHRRRRPSSAAIKSSSVTRRRLSNG